MSRKIEGGVCPTCKLVVRFRRNGLPVVHSCKHGKLCCAATSDGLPIKKCLDCEADRLRETLTDEERDVCIRAVYDQFFGELEKLGLRAVGIVARIKDNRVVMSMVGSNLPPAIATWLVNKEADRMRVEGPTRAGESSNDVKA